MVYNKVLRPGFRALTFLGASTVREVDECIIDYLLMNPDRQKALFAEAELIKRISRRFGGGLIAPQLKAGLRDTPELRLAYRLAMPNVDGLIFQSVVQLGDRPFSNDMLEYGWKIGKSVACGILAEDVQQMAARVTELMQTWNEPLVNASIGSIVAAFNRTSVSDPIREYLSLTTDGPRFVS
jgi:hypothetical protein